VASQFRQAVASHVISSDSNSDYTSSESEAEDELECKEQQDETASSKWRREYCNTPFERIEFLPPRHSRTPPAAATSALDFFSLLFTPAFVQHIVQLTNEYARR
jgi:hypothetical protein